MRRDLTFILVACGEAAYLNSVNYSVRFLKKFSSANILVLTDLARNEIDIQAANVIDVPIDQKYTNRQASILLKTGLNQHIEIGSGLYCYLDSDVVAIKCEVVSIFDFHHSPITFASDHYPFDMFSPFAMRCNCKQEKASELEELNRLIRVYRNELIDGTDSRKQKFSNILSLEREWARLKGIERENLQGFVPMSFCPRYVTQKMGYQWNPEKSSWSDHEGHLIYSEMDDFVKPIETSSDFRWNAAQQQWNRNGRSEDVFDLRCSHLEDGLKQKFGVEISEGWQHHNGGVFTFDASAADFLNAWHEAVQQVFEDDLWKTRDQSALIAVIWQLGLQDQPRLPREFNLLADYNQTEMKYRSPFMFSLDNFQTTIHPKLIHVINHYGDENWIVWKDIAYLLE